MKAVKTKRRQAPGRKTDIERYGKIQRNIRYIIAYPWDRWLKKGQFILWKGKDYGLPSDKFAQQVRNTATEKKLDVSIKVRPYAVAITVWDRVKEKA